jgi:hypothetical protein
MQLHGQTQAGSGIDAAFTAFVAAQAGFEYPRQVDSKGRRHDERSGSEAAVEGAHQVSQIEHGSRDERVINRAINQGFHRSLVISCWNRLSVLDDQASQHELNEAAGFPHRVRGVARRLVSGAKGGPTHNL